MPDEPTRINIETDTTPRTADFNGLPVHVAASLHLRDDDGREWTSEDVQRAFEDLSAVGYCVKMRLDVPVVMLETYPAFGRVTGITDEAVSVHDHELHA